MVNEQEHQLMPVKDLTLQGLPVRLQGALQVWQGQTGAALQGHSVAVPEPYRAQALARAQTPTRHCASGQSVQLQG